MLERDTDVAICHSSQRLMHVYFIVDIDDIQASDFPSIDVCSDSL